MKKILFLLLICLFIFPCLYAAENNDDEENATEEESEDEGKKKKRKPFGIHDRKVEIGLVKADVHLANNFLSTTQLLQETIVLDIDDLSKGFRINFGALIDLPYFKYTNKKGWGFGIYTEAEAIGLVDLAGEMLTFKAAKNAQSSVGGAAFAAVSAEAFFPIEKFKIKIKPSFYYTLLYTKPAINYTFDTAKGMIVAIDYDMSVYMPLPLSGDSKKLSAKPGFDISLGLSYPLAREIGLFDKIKLLDFDIGVDLLHIPIIPSSMTDYMRWSGKIGNDKPFILGDEGSDIDSFFGSLTGGGIVSGNFQKKERITRPFKTMFWADWRPLGGIRLLTVHPSIGFAVNSMYVKSFSMEGGVSATLNLANLFIVTGGINYTDRMWVNSLDFILNFRVFQLDFGVNLRSQSFAKSWTGAGVGANVGLKFGW